MPVEFENYLFSYPVKGKPVFVPNSKCREYAVKIIQDVRSEHRFPDFFYHLMPGGHIAALHKHRENTYFCKIDLKNYFYSISRNRVARVLSKIGLERAQHFSKWSCIKNPFLVPKFCLPYGFPQSPILASLVLDDSAVGKYLREIQEEITPAVYVDDISLSSDNFSDLRVAFGKLKEIAQESNFRINEEKVVEPCKIMDIFNITLQKGSTKINWARVEKFYQYCPDEASILAFEAYKSRIEKH